MDAHSNRQIEQTKSYMHSVLMSFVPISIILLIYFAIKIGISAVDFNPGSFIYTLIVVILLMSCNLVCYSTLASIIVFKIYWRSCILTNGFLIGIILSNQSSVEFLNVFGNYFMCLCFFHLSEFVFTALYNHKEVSTDSFLLNHSMEYGLAAMASWVEFFLEGIIFPSLKLNIYIRSFGLFLIIFGEIFRKLAMYTAGTNFNHYVQEKRQDDHVLVTKGKFFYFTKIISYYFNSIYFLNRRLLIYTSPILFWMVLLVNWHTNTISQSDLHHFVCHSFL